MSLEDGTLAMRYQTTIDQEICATWLAAVLSLHFNTANFRNKGFSIKEGPFMVLVELFI